MKKIIMIILIFIISIIIGIFVYYLKFNSEEFNIEYNYIELISSKNIENINNKLLNYVNDNYKNALEEIYNSIENNIYNENIWREETGYSLNVLLDKSNDINHKIIDDSKNTITFVGDTSLADNYYVIKAYNERNKGLEGILSKEVINYLNDSSVLIANSEFAFGTSNEPMPGKMYTFIGNPNNVSIYKEMGVDLVTLANNHVYDYGSEAFNETLNTFDNNDIPRIGAGSNLEEASRAYYFIINGYKVSFINANRSEKTILTPGATETTEGVFRCYDPTNLIKKIKEEKKVSDIVIPIIHWGLEGSHKIEDVLLETGKEYVDAGADAIVGHHAHVLQGIEFYNGKPIVYNIGNFIFDNYSRELGVVTFKINDDMSLEYTFLPALQENVYTDFLYDNEKLQWINNMNDWSINTIIDPDGSFYAKN